MRKWECGIRIEKKCNFFYLWVLSLELSAVSLTLSRLLFISFRIPHSEIKSLCLLPLPIKNPKSQFLNLIIPHSAFTLPNSRISALCSMPHALCYSTGFALVSHLSPFSLPMRWISNPNWE